MEHYDFHCGACKRYLVPEDYPHTCQQVSAADKTIYYGAEFDGEYWSYGIIEDFPPPAAQE